MKRFEQTILHFCGAAVGAIMGTLSGFYGRWFRYRYRDHRKNAIREFEAHLERERESSHPGFAHKIWMVNFPKRHK